MPPRRRLRRRRCPSPSSSSSSSSSIEQQLRYVVFPPNCPYQDFVAVPPSPPPCTSSFIVPPTRPSKPQPSIILPHPLFPGVYVAADHDYHESCNNLLYTKNLVPGVQSRDQDVLFSIQDEDGRTVEYREWDPFKSRLAAAILSGAQNIWIKPGSRVLVLFSRDDEQFGITISHISDIVGPKGMVYAVETSNGNTLLNMADKRFNIVPVVLTPDPWQFRMLINVVDVLFAALDCPDEVHMACLNAKYFLKTGGHYMLYVQGHCMESTSNRGDDVFGSQVKGDQVQFKRMEQVTLEPFDRNHAYVSGVYRTMEIAEIDPSCLVSSKFWTSQDSHRGNGRRISLYEKQKNLPVFMLFESSCGYVLFRAHDVYKVERNYVASEEYIKSLDKYFEFVACHTFESSDDALMYLIADWNDTLPEKLLEFLVLHLPQPAMKGDEHCYTLALSNPCMADDIVSNAKIACSSSHFHIDIIRGVRMNIEKFFKNMKASMLMLFVDTLPEKLLEFLVLHLPQPAMKDDEHCYTLALSNPCMADDIVSNAKIACSSSHFHIDIIRGVRMNIEKFFKNMKPGDLEKAQLDLARICSRQKLSSPDKRKLPKKRRFSG